MKLSVVIVNYNVKHFLWQCLDSVSRAIKGLEADIYVVDNASEDGSIDYVRPSFPNVHYITNTDNSGFAKANNQAIRASKGELVLLLNPDTFIAEDCLRGCIQFFESHPRAGALGIHMINRDGSFARESRRGLPTPATAFYKIIGLNKLFPTSSRFARYHMGHLPEFADAPIEAVSGAFLMLRRQALEHVGLLDETYFMYGEDIDLSYRISQGGWECWYTPELMLHYKGESTQQTSFRYVYNFYNAMLIFFNKHFARRYWFAWIFVEAAVLAVGALSYLRKQFANGHHRLQHWTRELLGQKQPSADSVLQMAFMGSEEAFAAIKPLCDQAHIDAYTVQQLDDVKPDSHILTFEISSADSTDEQQPYSHALKTMMEAHRKGYQLTVGTFNLQTKTFILPNDIYC